MLSISEGMPVSLPILHAHVPDLPAQNPSANGRATPQPMAFAVNFASRIERVRLAATPPLVDANMPHGPVKAYLAESLMRAAHHVQLLDSPKVAAVANAPRNRMMVDMALAGCANHCNTLMETMDAVLDQGSGLHDGAQLKACLERAAASIATLIDVVDQIDKATPASETPFRYAIGATVALVGFFSMYYLWSAQQNFSTIGTGSDTSTAYTYNDGVKNLASGLGYGIVTISAGCLLRYDRLHAPGGTRQLATLLSDLRKAKIALELIDQHLGNVDFLNQVCIAQRRQARERLAAEVNEPNGPYEPRETPVSHEPLEGLNEAVAQERAQAIADERV